MREQLPVPENIELEHVIFLDDCIMLILSEDAVNTWYKEVAERNHLPTKNEMVGLFRFDHYLIDNVGNYCHLFLVATQAESDTVDHEYDHHQQYDYYLRPQLPKKDRRREKNFYTTAQENPSILNGVLSMSYFSYLRELMSAAAEDSLTQQPENWRLILQLYVPYFLASSHQYFNHAQNIVDAKKGAVSNILAENTDELAKLDLWYGIEKSLAIGISQMDRVGRLVEQLAKKCKGDRQELLSSLYAVPISRPHLIGYFIDIDPRAVTEYLTNRVIDPLYDYLPAWSMIMQQLEKQFAVDIAAKIEALSIRISKDMQEIGSVSDPASLPTQIRQSFETELASIREEFKILMESDVQALIKNLEQIQVDTTPFKQHAPRIIATYLNDTLPDTLINKVIGGIL